MMMPAVPEDSGQWSAVAACLQLPTCRFSYLRSNVCYLMQCIQLISLLDSYTDTEIITRVVKDSRQLLAWNGFSGAIAL
jgi:hypothetical protein